MSTEEPPTTHATPTESAQPAGAAAPETYVPKFLELQYGWVLCLVAFDRWPQVWEYTQWYSDQWRAFVKAKSSHYPPLPKSRFNNAYERVLAVCDYENEKAHSLLHAWLAPRVAKGLTLDQVRERVQHLYEERKRSLA